MSENDFKDFMEWLKGSMDETEDDKAGSDTASTGSTSASDSRKVAPDQETPKPTMVKMQQFDEAPVAESQGLADCSVCGKDRSCT